MEFSTEISAKEFKWVRYNLSLENKKRNIIHRISQVFVLGILLIPFIQVMLLGISRHASFWTICKTYPSFFVAKGWATEVFFLWVLTLVITSPRIMFLITRQKAYEQFLKNQKVKKLVFSDVRVCGYSEDNTLLTSWPYTNIRKIFWTDDFAAIITNVNQCYPVCLKELNESQQEELVQYLESMQHTTIEITKDLTYSVDDVVWQQDIQLTSSEVEQFMQMYHATHKKNGWTLLLMSGVCGVLSILNFLPLIFIIFMLVFLIQGLRFLLPQNPKRNLNKTLKQVPEYIDFLSGTTALTPRGMYRYQKSYYNLYRWEQMTHTIIGAAGVMVMQNNKIAGLIPRNRFESDTQFLHYAHWIEQQIQQAKAAANIVPLAQKR